MKKVSFRKRRDSSVWSLDCFAVSNLSMRKLSILSFFLPCLLRWSNDWRKSINSFAKQQDFHNFPRLGRWSCIIWICRQEGWKVVSTDSCLQDREWEILSYRCWGGFHFAFGGSLRIPMMFFLWFPPCLQLKSLIRGCYTGCAAHWVRDSECGSTAEDRQEDGQDGVLKRANVTEPSNARSDTFQALRQCGTSYQKARAVSMSSLLKVQSCLWVYNFSTYGLGGFFDFVSMNRVSFPGKTFLEF